MHIPVFSLIETNITATLTLIGTNKTTISSSSTIALNPGHNVVTISKAFALTYTTVRNIEIFFAVAEVNRTEIGFWVSAQDELKPATFSYVSDSASDVLVSSYAALSCRLYISASTLGYLPIHEYSVILTPDLTNSTFRNDTIVR
jgi:hypothetical protein